MSILYFVCFSDFNLEEKIDALPPLSLEDFQTKKRARKKRNSSSSPVNSFYEAMSIFEDFERQEVENMKTKDTLSYSLSGASNCNSQQKSEDEFNTKRITEAVGSPRKEFFSVKVKSMNETDMSPHSVKNTPSSSPHQNIKPLNISSRVFETSYIPHSTNKGFTRKLNSSCYVSSNNSYFCHEPIRQDLPLPLQESPTTAVKTDYSSASSSVLITPKQLKDSLPGKICIL